MKHNTELRAVVAALKKRNLGKAIVLLENYGFCYPEYGIIEPLNNIKNDFNLMANYWRQGYKDAQAAALYDRLLRQMYQQTADIYIYESISKDPLFGNAYRRSRSTGKDWSLEMIRSEMENYVGEMTLLELEPPHTRGKRAQEIRQKHSTVMSNLFDLIRTSQQWSDSMAEEYTALLLSPTIDSHDRALIISAIMMGAMWVFDFGKWTTLARVYQQTTDEKARQRALVGWTLTIGQGLDAIFPAQRAIINELFADERTAEEILALQMQMLYCANAENDTRTIQKEIMPELIKNNNLRITPNGIEEKEDDTMEDILDTGAAERKMAEMEGHFKRMMDMQKSGADIYFGGFSQMKRFPFFDSMSNWFVPFSINNPAITALYANEKDLKLAQMVVDRGMFCDSDKYSFVIAFQRTVSSLPSNLREMVGTMGEAFEAPDMEKSSPSYLRRIYLQDLYRFFMLYPSRSRFDNPFAEIIIDNHLFADTPLASKATQMAAFLVKRKMLTEAGRVLDRYAEGEADYNYCMLRGYIASHTEGSTDEPEKWYAQALTFQPDSIKALTGYGRALLSKEKYHQAADVYGRLLLSDETNTTARYNRALCLIMLKRYEEATEHLFRLDYEKPDNPRIQSLLAMALMNTDKLDQAEKLLERMLFDGDSEAIDNHSQSADVLSQPADSPSQSVDSSARSQQTRNAPALIALGIVKWCKGDIQAAINHLSKYMRTSYPTVSLAEWCAYCEDEIINPHRDILTAHGITEIDLQMMRDVLLSEE